MGSEALGGLLVGIALAVAFASLFGNPFLCAPGFALGARRTAAWTVLLAVRLSVAGLAIAIAESAYCGFPADARGRTPMAAAGARATLDATTRRTE